MTRPYNAGVMNPAGLGALLFPNVLWLWFSEPLHVLLVFVIPVAVLFVWWPLALTMAALIPLWCIAGAIHQGLYRARSARCGLKNMVLKPESGRLLQWLLERGMCLAGAPEAGLFMEVHTRVKSYRYQGGVTAYLRDLAADGETLAALFLSGRLGTSRIVCSSFNRHLIRAIMAGLDGRAEMTVLEGRCLYPAGMRLYSPRRYKTVQKKMFGTVVSKRDVSRKDAWRTVIVKK